MITSPVLKQALLSICVSWAYFCCALVRGYTAPGVPSMNELNPGLLPNQNIMSWISSVAPLAAFFGSLLASPVMERFGRRYTVMITSPCWVLSWAIIACATRWEYLLAGRILSGIFDGLALPSAQIYVSECANPEIRGILGTFPALAMSVGVVVAYIEGTFYSWSTVAWINCGNSAALFVLLFLLPDSPVWLKHKGRVHEAQASADWLKLTNWEEDSETNKVADNEVDPKEGLSCSVFLSRRIFLPLMIGLTLLCIQQLSGIDAIVFFTVEMFEAAGSTLDGHLSMILIASIQVACNIVILFMIDKCGRRPLLIYSGVVMTISTFFMGLAFYMKNNGNMSFGYLPVVSLIVFMLGFSVGFGPVPFLIMGEIFPTKYRSLLSSISGSANLLIMFFVVKSYHPLEAAITTAGTFWLYAVFCAFGVIFVLFYLPETKGRSLESIEKLFLKKKKPNKDDVAVIDTISAVIGNSKSELKFGDTDNKSKRINQNIVLQSFSRLSVD